MSALANDPALLLDPGALEIDAEPSADELDSLLVTGEAPVVFSERELAESIYKAEQHPRWPPGSKDATGKPIGGQFMRIGQAFMHDGHRWEIAQVAEGHVIAHEASGSITAAQTKVFSPTPAKFGAKDAVQGMFPTIKGVERAAAKKLTAGSGKTAHSSTIVDARVNPSSHDSSIKLPAGSKLTDEEWAQFGRADQLYYREVMDRFGAWSAPAIANAGVGQHHSKLTSILQKANQEFGDHDATGIVISGFKANKGSSAGGVNLSCTSVFKGLTGGGPPLEKAQERYEHAKEVQGDINALLAWDLFNRTRAPDVTMIHRSGDSEGFFGSIVAGQDPYMSGLSNSWAGTWGESNAVVAAVPIREIVFSEELLGNYGCSGEHEFSWANRLKLSPQTAVFMPSSQVSHGASHGSGKAVWNWIQDHVAKNPVGGYVAKGVAAHLSGQAELPLPPAEADFILKHAPGEKTHYIPPNDFMKTVEDAVAKNPGQTVTEKLPVAELNLKPGDVIEGNTEGLRYLVIEDKGLGSGTIRYVALGKGAPGNYDSSDKLYTTSGSRKKVNLHFDLPPEPKPEKKAVYQPSEFAPSGEAVKVGTFAVGDRLRIQDDDWEVTATTPTLTTLKSLTTGAEATVNSQWKTKKLTPLSTFKPQEGELVLGAHGKHGPLVVRAVKKLELATPSWETTLPNGETAVFHQSALSPLPSFHPQEPPEKGDTFAGENGAKMIVTNVLKNGHVRARAAVPGAKVQDFAPDHPALTGLFRPEDFALGAKGKLGQMTPGQLFSGSPVKKRPYMVLGTIGKDTHVLNLDTGEESSLSKNKSYTMLTEGQPLEGKVIDGTGVDHDELQPNSLVDYSQLHIGDTFTSDVGQEGPVYQVTGEATSSNGKEVWKVQGLIAQTPFVLSKTKPGQVVFKGHSELGEDAAPMPVVDVQSLPDAIEHGGFEPYTSNAGPGNAYKHDKLKMLESGTVFLDKTGKPWMVKKSGPQPIITDGESLYSVSGDARAKNAVHAKKPVVFEDHSPPVGSSKDAVSKQSSDTMELNTLLHSLGELALEPGDTFVLQGHVWTVAESGASSVKGVNADNGAVQFFGNGIVPSQFSKQGAIPNPPEPESEPEEPALKIPAGWKVTGRELGISKMPVGTHFYGGIDDGAVLKKIAHSPTGKIKVKTIVAGTGSGAPGKVGAEFSTGVSDAENPLKILEPTQPVTSSAEPLFEDGPVVQAKDVPAHGLAKLVGGTIAYKSGGGAWFQVGGGTVGVAPQAPVTSLHVNMPEPEDLEHTGETTDVHGVQAGETFFIGDKGYVMLGHGPDGAAAMRLSDGVILGAPTGQHKQVELATVSGQTPTSEEPSLGSEQDTLPPGLFPNDNAVETGELPVGSIYAFGEAGNWDVTKIISKVPYMVTQHPGAKTGQSASPKFVPPYVWLPPGATMPEKQGPSVASLKKGDQFVIPPGYAGEGSKYEVVDTALAWHEASGNLPDYSTVTVKPVDGDVTQQIASTLVPSEITPAADVAGEADGWETIPEEASAGNTVLHPGDQFTDEDGDVHTVTKVEGDVTTGGQSVFTAWDSPAGLKDSGPWTSLSITKIKRASPSAVPAVSSDMPISPYGSPYQSGGKAKYEHIADLAVGDSFKDKKGDTYTVTHSLGHEGDVTIVEGPNGEVAVPHYFTDAKGKQKPTRVKLLATAAPGPSEEPLPPESVKASGMQVGTIFKNSIGGKFVVNAVTDNHVDFVKLSGKGSAQGHVATDSPVVYELVSHPETTAPTPEDDKGWKTSPTPVSLYDIHWEPGDQWIDFEGDVQTFTGYSSEGAPMSTWHTPGMGGHEFGPLAWEKSSTAATTKWRTADVAPPPSAAPEPGTPVESKAIPNYNAYDLKTTGSAGGTTGAQFAKDEHGTKWLIKQYGGNEDRVATELLANSVYRALGVKAAEAGTFTKDGKTALAYPLMPGKTAHFSGSNQAKMTALGKDFMADALVANYDFVGLEDDNVLWNGSEPTRVDQGGTFMYRAQGKPKTFGPVPDEVWSMLTVGQGKNGVKVSESDLRQQAAHIAETLTSAKINELVAQAPFQNEGMKEEIRKNLISRVEWMKGFAAGDPSPVFEIPAGVHLEPDPVSKSGKPRFKSLAVGDHFKATGALWQKTSPFDAKVVQQLEPETAKAYKGDVGSFHKFSEVDPVTPTAAPKPDVPGEKLFPGQYKGDTWGDLGVGDVFKQSKSGIVWKVTGVNPVTAFSVQSGKTADFSGKSSDQPIVITKKGAPETAKPDEVDLVIDKALDGIEAEYKGHTISYDSNDGDFEIAAPDGTSTGGLTSDEVADWLHGLSGDGALVKARDLKAGDKIKPLAGKSIQGTFDDTWIVNGLSDNGEHVSLTNEEGWSSTTIPKDDTLVQHVGYATPLYPSPNQASEPAPMAAHARANDWMGSHTAHGEPVSEGSKKVIHDLAVTHHGNGKDWPTAYHDAWVNMKGFDGAEDLKAAVADAMQSAVGAPSSEGPVGKMFDAFYKGKPGTHGEWYIEKAGDGVALFKKVGLVDGEKVAIAFKDPSGLYITKVKYKPDIDNVAEALRVVNPDHTALAAVDLDDKIRAAKVELDDEALEPAMPITPYGSPYQSGGKAPYHKISDLEPGDKFRDKTGSIFTVQGHDTVGDFTQAMPHAIGHPQPIAIPHTFTDPKTGKTKPTRVRKVEA